MTIFKSVPAFLSLNPFALRKAKIVYNFDLSECKKVKEMFYSIYDEFILLPGSFGQTIFKSVPAFLSLNPFALRKAKIVYNFDLSECKKVKEMLYSIYDELILLPGSFGQTVSSNLYQPFCP